MNIIARVIKYFENRTEYLFSQPCFQNTHDHTMDSVFNEIVHIRKQPTTINVLI